MTSFLRGAPPPEKNPGSAPGSEILATIKLLYNTRVTIHSLHSMKLAKISAKSAVFIFNFSKITSKPDLGHKVIRSLKYYGQLTLYSLSFELYHVNVTTSLDRSQPLKSQKNIRTFSLSLKIINKECPCFPRHSVTTGIILSRLL